MFKTLLKIIGIFVSLSLMAETNDSPYVEFNIIGKKLITDLEIKKEDIKSIELRLIINAKEKG